MPFMGPIFVGLLIAEGARSYRVPLRKYGWQYDLDDYLKKSARKINEDVPPRRQVDRKGKGRQLKRPPAH